MTAKLTHHFISRDYIGALKDYCISKGVDIFALSSGRQAFDTIFLNNSAYVDVVDYVQLIDYLYRYRPSIFDQQFSSPLAVIIDYCQWAAMRNANGTLGMTMRCADNFEQAAKMLEQYSISRSNLFQYRLSKDADYLYLSLKQLFALPATISPKLITLLQLAAILSAGLFFYKALNAGGQRGYYDLYAKLGDNDDLGLLTGIGCCNYQYSQITAIRVPINMAQLPFASANPLLSKRLLKQLIDEKQQLPGQDTSSQLQRLIRNGPWSSVSLESCAEQLNISASTLQRRLRRENISFKQLRNQERQHQAEELLRFGQQSIDNIASQLDYSNASNFAKSFRAATGMTPKAFRQLHRNA